MVDGKLDAMRAIELFKDLWRERHVGRALGANVVIDAKDLIESLGHVGEIVGCQ